MNGLDWAVVLALVAPSSRLPPTELLSALLSLLQVDLRPLIHHRSATKTAADSPAIHPHHG